MTAAASPRRRRPALVVFLLPLVTAAAAPRRLFMMTRVVDDDDDVRPRRPAEAAPPTLPSLRVAKPPPRVEEPTGYNKARFELEVCGGGTVEDVPRRLECALEGGDDRRAWFSSWRDARGAFERLDPGAPTLLVEHPLPPPQQQRPTLRRGVPPSASHDSACGRVVATVTVAVDVPREDAPRGLALRLGYVPPRPFDVPVACRLVVDGEVVGEATTTVRVGKDPAQAQSLLLLRGSSAIDETSLE